MRVLMIGAGGVGDAAAKIAATRGLAQRSVSYTHLTLPTKRIV